MRQNQTSGDVPSIPLKKIIGIVCSSYHRDVVGIMQEDAERRLRELGAANILVIHVPGAFEIPLACLNLIRRNGVHGIMALGVIVQGETHHAAEIARACTDGLLQVQLSNHVPIVHEVLYVDTIKSARERAGGDFGKGREAAESLALMMQVIAE